MIIFKIGPYLLKKGELTEYTTGKAGPLTETLVNVLWSTARRTQRNGGSGVLASEIMNDVWSEKSVSDPLNSLRNAFTTIRSKTQQQIKISYDEGLCELTPAPELWDIGANAPATGQRSSFTSVEELAYVRGVDPKASPYPGSRPFSRSDADKYAGRDTELNKLCELLESPSKRVVLFYSPSGAGKSSLISAALEDRLAKKDATMLPIARVVDVEMPIEHARANARQNPYVLAAALSTGRCPEPPASGDPITWTTFLDAQGIKRPTVVVIDQLEDLLNIDVGDRRLPEQFFVEMSHALRTHPLARFLLVFREEYLGPMRRTGRPIADDWAEFLMGMMSQDDAKLAIRQPAGPLGVSFDDKAVGWLTTELCRTRLGYGRGEVEREYISDTVAPLHIQLVCAALWSGLPEGIRSIKLDDVYTAIGRWDELAQCSPADIKNLTFVERVVDRFFDLAISAIENDREHDSTMHRKLIEVSLRQFVSHAGTRIALRAIDGYVGALPLGLANELNRVGLLRMEIRNGERQFELAHDALIAPMSTRAALVTPDDLVQLVSEQIGHLLQRETSSRSDLSEESVLNEFCVMFIGEDQRPLTVTDQALRQNNARLPHWMIPDLCLNGVLRITSTEKGKPVTYEIAHVEVVRALHQERFTALRDLSRVRRALAERVTAQQERNVESYSAAEIAQVAWMLLDVDKVIGLSQLTEQEARWALGAALTLPEDAMKFVEPLQKKFPRVAADYLQTFVRPSNIAEHMRVNAVRGIAISELADRETMLTNLALNDRSQRVRQTAAASLAAKATDATWRLPLALGSHNRHAALSVLSWMRDALKEDTQTASAAPQLAEQIATFEKWKNELPQLDQVRLRLRVMAVRWRRLRSRVGLAMLVSMIVTVAFTAPARSIIALFGGTTTQLYVPGAAEGLFHGVFGAAMWALSIGYAALTWMFLSDGRRPWVGRNLSIAGALAGSVGGAFVSAVLISVYGARALSEMRWIASVDAPLSEAWLSSGLAWIMPLYGTFIGASTGEAVRQLLPWWNNVYKKDNDKEIQTAPRDSFVDIVINCLPKMWLSVVSMLIAFGLAHQLIQRMPAFQVTPYSTWKLAGDALDLLCGGTSLIVGVFVGLRTLNRGIQIKPGEE